ncbi:MAG: response regulator [Cupriavidus sp.]|nr:response regulator [Cupriavidus sp.]
MGSSGQFAVVVDDDESVARAISRLLRAAGITVETFTSGAAFLDQVLSQPTYRPRCAILDVSMPDIDGLEVQRRLAGMPMAIIFITAHDVPEARDKALSSGAIGYLRKPFNTTQLIELVRGVMAS